MASEFEKKFLDLLHFDKDPSNVFNVKIAELLESFIEGFKNKNIPVNFTSAAILIQAGAHAYGRKVEHLHCLASCLYAILVQNKKNDEEDKSISKGRAPRKEKEGRIKEFDPLCSVEITPGKNLSCLTKKNTAKKATPSKKAPKTAPHKIHSFVPVDLLPLEDEEKGDIFYDTKGEPIGREGDYMLNRLRVNTGGWLHLATLSPELFMENEDASSDCHSDMDDSDGVVPDSPCDEGYPASSGCPSSAPHSQALSSQGTDEGLGSLQSTPCESYPVQEVEGVGSGTPMKGLMEVESAGLDTPMEVEGVLQTESNGPVDIVENIPANDLVGGAEGEGGGEEEDPGTRPEVPSKPVRHSKHQAQKQLNPEEEGTNNGEEFVAFKAPIEKKSTFILPAILRNIKPNLPPAAVYCGQTFFPMDSEFQKSDLYSFQVTAFAYNSKLTKVVNKFKDDKCKKKKRGDNAEEGENAEEDGNDVEGGEELREADADDGEPANPGLENSDFEINGSPAHSLAANPGLEIGDFEIHNSPAHSFGGDGNEIAEEIPTGNVPSMDEKEGNFDLDAEFKRLAAEQMAQYKSTKESSRVNENVREWQKNLRPFLSEISKREKFDINLYGSRILDAFDESNRRQTMTFREFCKGTMEKWEVHRYFMALLPLANNGNVELSNEPREDDEGEQDIVITLLSRKMHHLEVKEFGHSTGEHS